MSVRVGGKRVSDLGEREKQKLRKWFRETRSRRSVKMDLSRTSKRIPVYVSTWKRHPDRYDIPGIDTKKQKTHTEAKASELLLNKIKKHFVEAPKGYEDLNKLWEKIHDSKNPEDIEYKIVSSLFFGVTGATNSLNKDEPYSPKYRFGVFVKKVGDRYHLVIETPEKDLEYTTPDPKDFVKDGKFDKYAFEKKIEDDIKKLLEKNGMRFVTVNSFTFFRDSKNASPVAGAFGVFNSSFFIRTMPNGMRIYDYTGKSKFYRWNELDKLASDLVGIYSGRQSYYTENSHGIDSIFYIFKKEARKHGYNYSDDCAECIKRIYDGGIYKIDKVVKVFPVFKRRNDDEEEKGTHKLVDTVTIHGYMVVMKDEKTGKMVPVAIGRRLGEAIENALLVDSDFFGARTDIYGRPIGEDSLRKMQEKLRKDLMENKSLQITLGTHGVNSENILDIVDEYKKTINKLNELIEKDKTGDFWGGLGLTELDISTNLRDAIVETTGNDIFVSNKYILNWKKTKNITGSNKLYVGIEVKRGITYENLKEILGDLYYRLKYDIVLKTINDNEKVLLIPYEDFLKLKIPNKVKKQLDREGKQRLKIKGIFYRTDLKEYHRFPKLIMDVVKSLGEPRAWYFTETQDGKGVLTLDYYGTTFIYFPAKEVIE